MWRTYLYLVKIYSTPIPKEAAILSAISKEGYV
jgi:hypothetical protein